MDNEWQDLKMIGMWTLRIVLFIGAAFAVCTGKKEVANGCVIACVMSFLFS